MKVLLVIFLSTVLGCAQTGPLIGYTSLTTPSSPMQVYFISTLSAVHPRTYPQMAQLISDHAAYWKQIASNGNLVIRGETVSNKLGQIVIYKLDRSKEDAAFQIAHNDPLVKRGKWTTTVYKWMTTEPLPQEIAVSSVKSYYLGLLFPGPKYRQMRRLVSGHVSPEWQALQAAEMADIRRLLISGQLIAEGPLVSMQSPNEIPDCPLAASVPFSPDNLDLACRPSSGLSSHSTKQPRAIFLLRCADVAQARSLMNANPEVSSGSMKAEVYSWTVVATD